MKAEKYVITGGPGCGKSTLIERLKNCGCEVIPESAKQVIDGQLELGGSSLPWKNRLKFQEEVAWFQQIKEENLIVGKSYFLDRSIIDNVAYFLIDDIIPSEEFEKTCDKLNSYSKVFVLNLLPVQENTYFRKENREKSIEIEKTLMEVYKDYGHSPIKVPFYPGSPSKRIEFVLDHIEYTNFIKGGYVPCLYKEYENY